MGSRRVYRVNVGVSILTILLAHYSFLCQGQSPINSQEVRYVVKSGPQQRPGKSNLRISKTLRASTRSFHNNEYTVIRIPASNKAELTKLLEDHKAKDLLVYYELDHIGYGSAVQRAAPNDLEFDNQWYLANDGTFDHRQSTSTAGADIEVLPAWDLTEGDSSVTVAIIDSGISTFNQDLANRLWRNPREIPGNNIDDDGNGYVDDIHGWNFITGSDELADDNGHGSSIAGIIAASTNNRLGISGIDWRCKLMLCKALDQNLQGFLSDWAEAIYYAVDNGANIINMSLNGDSDLRVLADAIKYASDNRVLVVASIGNNNQELVTYPAGYASTIAVGSTDPDDQRSTAFAGVSSFGSNYGNIIDVVAPGSYIYSYDNLSSNPRFWSGTSMSCAVVSGVASLLLSMNTALGANELRSILTRTAEDQVGTPSEDTAGWDKFYGFGRVNAFRAVSSSLVSRSVEDHNAFLYPNPVSTEITLEMNLDALSPITLRVTDMKGTIVMDQVIVPTSKSFKETLELSSMAPSTYILYLESREFRMIRKVIKI